MPVDFYNITIEDSIDGQITNKGALHTSRIIGIFSKRHAKDSRSFAYLTGLSGFDNGVGYDNVSL